jgi:DNA topoisomerase VI subunit B
MGVTGQLERTVFATPRAAEFLEPRALQAQTGQPRERFGDVVVKELLDNALDAAEAAGVAPETEITWKVTGNTQLITIADNGPGLPGRLIERILDFGVLVSDKAAYRSPTRGLQGNAWKTIAGIPYALGVTEPVVVEAHGIRHEIAVSIDPGGNVVIRHEQAPSARAAGTSVTVPLPAELAVDIPRWAEAFACFNPHATVIHPAESGGPETTVSYKPTAPEGWAKPGPSDPASAHWYDEAALTRLVYAHIGSARNGGRDLPVGEFIRSFAGLSSTAKAKAVKAAVPGIESLSGFESQPEAIGGLLAAMQAQSRPPKPQALGCVGEDPIREFLDRRYGVERFWYKRKALDHHGIPWALEVAVAETSGPGAVLHGVNYSPTFPDPLTRTVLDAGEISSAGADSFLRRCDAYPDPSNDHLRAAVVHVICPAAEFLDKGKASLEVPR